MLDIFIEKLRECAQAKQLFTLVGVSVCLCVELSTCIPAAKSPSLKGGYYHSVLFMPLFLLPIVTNHLTELVYPTYMYVYVA